MNGFIFMCILLMVIAVVGFLFLPSKRNVESIIDQLFLYSCGLMPTWRLKYFPKKDIFVKLSA